MAGHPQLPHSRLAAEAMRTAAHTSERVQGCVGRPHKRGVAWSGGVGRSLGLQGGSEGGKVGMWKGGLNGEGGYN